MTVSYSVRHQRHVFVIGVLLVLAIVISTLAAYSNPPADEWLYLQIRDLGALSSLSFLEFVRSVPFVIAVALPTLLALAGRCRVAMPAAAGAVVLSIALAWGLSTLLARPRPFDSPLTGTDSYPSPMIMLLATLLATYPLWRTVTGHFRSWTVLTAALWVLVVGSGLQEIHAALRWPLDVLGAVVIGLALGTLVRVVVETPELHRGCDSCSWIEIAAPLPPPREFVYERGHVAHPLYRAALIWAFALVIVFGVIFFFLGIPRLPESGVMGTGLEVPLNFGLLALIVIGVLLAAKWHATGAVIVALAAVLLGYAASMEYSPMVALAVATAAFVPAFLLWVQWHRVASLRSAATVSVVTAALLGTMIYFASDNYSYYWGPTNPTSATPAVQDDVVAWMWSGGVTTDSVVVRARTGASADSVRLVVGHGEGLENPVYSESVRSTAATQNVVAFEVDGLEPRTAYHYALEVDGVVDKDRIGRFSTFPEGPSSFTFALSGDARTGSNTVVFDAVRRTSPLFFLNMGDFFYGDVDVNDPGAVRDQYEANLTAPAQAALYASTPFVYMWGDHDYGGNDADKTSPSKPASMAVYRQYVPHYPLRPGAAAPLFQAFTVGDVRFVLTDNRSQRDPVGEKPRSTLGDQQRQWLFDELADADRYGLLVWVNPDPWVGKAEPGNDTWSGFADERRAVADAIARYDVDNLLMVSADAHMLAWDNGTNTDYSSEGDAAFPLFQAAALDRKESIKGGPYSGPVIGGGGQFGTLQIRDDGERVEVKAFARNYQEKVLFTRSFAVNRASGTSGQ